jgi:hypothetical protein
VSVDQDKDRGGTISVKVAEQVSAGYVSHNVLNGLEGSFDMRGIVHRKEDTSYKLESKEKSGQGTEASVVG